MLLFMVTNKDKVLSKEALAEHVWGDYIDSADSFGFVYAHIKNLRKKLDLLGVGKYLKTVYGVGYKFTDA
jgi:DNA-binding response OmpR family regulator